MKKFTFVCFTLSLFLLSSCYTSKSRSSGWDYQSDSYDSGFYETEARGKNGEFSLMETEELKSDIQLVGMVQAGNVNKRIVPVEIKPEEIEKKVIFNGSVTLLVKEPDSTSSQLEAIAKKYEGYASEIGSSRTTIRVKSTRVKEAMKDIAELGYVQSKRLSGKDVTNEYLDFQIRLDNAEKARTRYLQLLEKAENVEAALKVEKELERLNGTIDMINGNMNRINHLSEFSTITVFIKEKKKPGILGYIGIGLYRSVKWLFVRN